MVEEEEKGNWKVTKSNSQNLSPNWVAEKQDGETKQTLWGDKGESNHGHSRSDSEGTRWSRGTDGKEHERQTRTYETTTISVPRETATGACSRQSTITGSVAGTRPINVNGN
jgi:hypothetical protein